MATSRNSEPDEETLSVVNHRPYALPKRPWTMMQRWNDLLFAHWPIPAAKLESLLPSGLQVDTFDQSAWVGVVPFWMDRVQLRGVPRIPGASRFPELNLRTYVRERNTNRAGVYFFCLEASNPLAVIVAKAVFHLPYHWARMSIKVRSEREFTYQSERLLSAKPVRFRAHYRGLGQVRDDRPKPARERSSTFSPSAIVSSPPTAAGNCCAGISTTCPGRSKPRKRRSN